MKFRYTYLIWAGCLWLGVAGCASSGMNKKVAVTPVRTLTPDSMSTVGVDVNIHLPEKTAVLTQHTIRLFQELFHQFPGARH